MDFSCEFGKKAAQADEWIKSALSESGDIQGKIIEAMGYSIFAGGKRIRPVLMMAAYELFDENPQKIKEFVCAIEMIHTYSLIHDDLPAMDNSPMRRGRKTNHIVFGDGLATLAGDGLLNLAFEQMCACREDSGRVIKAMQIVSACSGVRGMIGGQVIDVLNEGKEIDIALLKQLHTKKTAALLCASVCAGAVLAGADECDVVNMKEYAINLGIAFQIKDDILDVTGDSALLGKPVGNDSICEKNTYVSILGMEESERLLSEYTQRSRDILKKYSERAKFLENMTEFLLNRDH